MYRKTGKKMLILAGAFLICLSGCGKNESMDEKSGKAAVNIRVTPTVSPSAAAEEGTSQSSGSVSNTAAGGSSNVNEGNVSSEGESGESESGSQYEIQSIDGHVKSVDGSTMYLETGSEGNYQETSFDISNAVIDIDNGRAVRSSLNVEVEYYVRDGVNVVTYLHSDGEEYMSPRVVEEYGLDMNAETSADSTEEDTEGETDQNEDADIAFEVNDTEE